MSEEFKILSARNHCRLRPGMYVGSVSIENIERFLLGKWGTITYVPAINKMISEIIDNSTDEFIRSNGKYATKIDVSIDENAITVTDNGRGIPQDFIVDDVTGEKILQPVAAWTKNNAGTSFGENRVTAGSHGLGSALVNYMSKSFVGTTWRNGNEIKVSCENGAETIAVTQKKRSGNGTEVSFVPDFSLFEIDSLSELDTIRLVEDRLISLQMAFPEITFSFNKRKINISDIKKYSEMFSVDGASVIVEKAENVSFFFAASEDGFRSNSYLNGVNTYQGGSYVDYIVNCVVEELAIMVKKKHKIDVTKSTLKGGLTFVLFVRNFVNPKFDSQTKERLTSSAGSVKEHYEKNEAKDFKTIAKKIFAAADIIEPIIEAQIAKKNADEKRDSLVAQKKLKKVKVAKHISASTSDSSLSLCEGDSACGFFLNVRDPKKHGIYPLRGVVMNTWDLKPHEVLKNKELSEVIAILNLDINKPNDISNMSYRDIWTLTDADVDGNKIATLLVAFFYKFWPKLFSEGKIMMLKTPIMIASKGKETFWAYTYEEAEEFKQNNRGWEIRYIKGLGLLTALEYDSILNNPVLYKITVEDVESSLFEMMFGNDSIPRKTFMMS